MLIAVFNEFTALDVLLLIWWGFWGLLMVLGLIVWTFMRIAPFFGNIKNHDYSSRTFSTYLKSLINNNSTNNYTKIIKTKHVP